MKKSRIIALVLVGVISIGSIFGGNVYATENKQQGTCADQSCEVEMEEELLDQELLREGVLSESELKEYNEAVDQIMKLYDDIEDQELSEELLAKLDSDTDKIINAHKNVFDKVDKYFEKISPENTVFEYDEVSQEDWYEELLANGVLTESEMDLLKEAENKLDALYEEAVNDDFTDEAFDKLLAKEDKIYEQYKAVYDKLDEYYEMIELEEMENFYKSLENEGWSQEQIKALKAADEKADELFEEAFDKLGENVSDEEIDAVLDEVFKKIDKLYEGLEL